MSPRDAHLHEAAIGQPLPDAELLRMISQHGKDPAVLAILHMLRNKVCSMEKAGSQVPVGADPHDYRAYHGGAADALEEFFWDVYRAGQTDLDKELEEGQ